MVNAARAAAFPGSRSRGVKKEAGDTRTPEHRRTHAGYRSEDIDRRSVKVRRRDRGGLAARGGAGSLRVDPGLGSDVSGPADSGTRARLQASPRYSL